MKAFEFEKAAFEWGMKTFKFPKGKFLKKGFKPLSIGIADFSIIKKGNTYHLFHIERRENGFPLFPGNEIFFGHTTTKDFCNWEVHQPALFISPDSWDNTHIWAPYVFKHNNTFYMFYTGVNQYGSQSIGLATSKDLFNWKKHKKNPIFTPPKWAYWHPEKPSPCRDPHIYYENNKFYLLYTASKKTGETCIGIAESANLLTWKDKGTLYTGPKNYSFPLKSKIPAHAESSCVHKFNDKYYLFIGINGGIRVFISDNLNNFTTPGKLIIKNQTSLEIIKRNDNEKKWIAAAFGLYDNKLYLHTLDFTDEIPTASPIKNPRKLNIIS